MRENNFENKVKDLLYDHQEAAPDVMSKVFQKRTPLYILRNKLILNKYKLLAASIVVGFLIGFFSLFNSLLQDGKDVVNSGNENTISKPLSNVDPAEKPDLDKMNTDTRSNEAVNAIKDDFTKVSTTKNGGSIQNNSAQNNKIVKTDLNEAASKNQNSNGNQVDIPKENLVNDADWNGDNVKANIIGNMASTEVEDDINVNNVINESNDADEGAEYIIDNIVNNESKTSQDENTQVVAESQDAEEVGSGEEFELPKTLPSKWSFTLGAGLGTGNRNIESKDASSMIARNNTEKQNLSFATELMVNYAATEQLDIFIGGNFYNRRESVEYEYPFTETVQNVTSKVVIQQHPVYGPRPITVYDTSYNTVDKVRNGNARNAYNHFTVPLGLRYTLQYDERLGISMALSGGLEVFTNAKGMVVDGAYNEVSLTNSYTKPAFGKVLGCGIGVSYKMNDNWSVLFEPRGMWYLTPSSITGTNVNQWEQGYNAMFGLKFRL